jgi:hypothetical protein
VLATDYVSELLPIAVAMFARWGQENFFRYMREHYGLDRLISYDTEPIPDTVRVVNPARRELEGKIRTRVGVLARRRAEFGGLTLHEPLDPRRIERWEKRKAALLEEITVLEQEVAVLKQRRQEIPSHIAVKDLPAEQRFERLAVQSKHFIDTIKMIAYRAETAMVNVLRDRMARHDDARSLVCVASTTARPISCRTTGPGFCACVCTIRPTAPPTPLSSTSVSSSTRPKPCSPPPSYGCSTKWSPRPPRNSREHRRRLTMSVRMPIRFVHPPRRRSATQRLTQRRLPPIALRTSQTKASCHFSGQDRILEIRRSEMEQDRTSAVLIYLLELARRTVA